MAQDSKPAFDPDATVSQALPEPDPEATVQMPGEALAGLRSLAGADDPEATVSGPLAMPEPDPEATDRLPVFDPDATFNPADRVALDPEATVRVPSPGRQPRFNPFAPQARPESLLTSLAGLGGVNALVAMANPILGAVPQIRRTLRHPDPARLKETLRDQIEGFEMSALSADVPDGIKESVVIALCALLDESAAATPWGAAWKDRGLLHELRNATDGDDRFFALVDQALAKAGSGGDENDADLLELLYVCLALGYEGRHRGSEEGRLALRQVKDRLFAQVARRHPRPTDGLSERWRTPAAQALVDEALATAARAAAARAAAEAAAQAAPPPPPPPSLLSRLPRRAIWSAVASLVGAAVVFYMLALRLLESDENSALASRPARTKAKATAPAPAAAPAPAPAAATVSIASALDGLPVSVTTSAGETRIAFQHARQFASGATAPAADLQPVLKKVAQALKAVPGVIVVAGHADASPVLGKGPSNQVISEARAQSVARLIAAELSDARRVQAEGRGDSAPLDTGTSPAARAKNRRVELVLKAP